MSTALSKGPDGAHVSKFPAPPFEFPASGEEPHHGDLPVRRVTPAPRRLATRSRSRPGARAIFWARAPAEALGVKQELERRWRRTASRQNNRPRERPGDNMTGTAQRETPQVAIFWLVQATEGEARLLAAGCPLDQADPYGDCLTYGPGHYETWTQWRRDRTVEPALRAIVRAYEYEDWPRGRIVFGRAGDLFVLFADRKLITPATIARIKTQFHLPTERAEVQSDFHYQSAETPNGLGK